MKRDPSLIPFSKFHRSCLFVALMAKKNAPSIEGYPDDFQGKLDYIKDFRLTLEKHFEKEEELWRKSENKHEELQEIIERLNEQREQIHQLLNDLVAAPKEDLLFQFGEDFEHHVRTEERVYFEALQKHYKPDELEQLVE